MEESLTEKSLFVVPDSEKKEYLEINLTVPPHTALHAAKDDEDAEGQQDEEDDHKHDDDQEEEDEDSEDERLLMQVREPPVYTESDTSEVSSSIPAARERKPVSNRRQGFWKLVLSACEELGILMTKEKLAAMSEDQSDSFYARVFETKVYQADRGKNFALRKKALKEAPYKPWSKDMREKLMRC